MKRLITLLLTFVLLLGLCACGDSGSKDETPTGLQVGYARERIHPKEPVPLSGYGQSEKRMSENTLDYLMGTCVAFKEGDTTILIFSQDLIFANGNWVKDLRALINNKLGIPENNIMICATHTHSGPDQGNSHASIANYHKLYNEQMLKAAKEAVADLSPATLYGTRIDAPINYIRHYTMNDGTYAGPNFGDWSSGITGYVREPDVDMQLIKIDREGDKKDIVMANWQCHSTMTGGVSKPDLSADYSGAFREKLEAATDMEFIYFLGASGDIAPNSIWKEDDHGMNYQQVGQALTDYALEALKNLKPIEGAGIQTSQMIFEGAVNHDDEHLGVEARKVKDVYETLGKDAATALAHTLGISSVYHANAILARPSRPATTTAEINTIRIGGLGFVAAPIEMFSDHGKYIKENSPFAFTIVSTCSNESKGYIPTADAFDYGCYESFTSTFAKGVGETLAEQYAQMLKGLQ